MRHVLAAVATALILVTTAPVLVSTPTSTSAPASASRLPSKEQWKRDVHEAMAGSQAYLDRVAARAAPGERLAVNLDIDNTMLATHYNHGHPVGDTFRFVARARELGMAVLVNSARVKSRRQATILELSRAGYKGAHAFDELCLRRSGVDAASSKQACRARFIGQGYRLVANVGNRGTDFVGGGYDRGFKLPNYHHGLT